MKRAYILIALAALPGCDPATPTPAPVPPPDAPVPGPPDPADDTCGAARYSGLLNQSEAQIATLGFDQPARIIRPGDPVTMDFNPGRINFLLDDQGNVDRIYCG